MKIGRNDPCSCGSGKKYKKCCLNKQIGLEVSQPSQRSIKERNIILYNAILDIFGFYKGKTWDDVRREMTDDQVRELYKVFAWLWPPKTDVMSLLPEPSNKLRGFYMGETNPSLNSVLKNIVRYSLYTDEVLVVNPFFSPWTLASEFNPIDNPSNYKQDTLEMIAFLFRISPWIESGFVNLIPNPIDYDSDLRTNVWGMAQKRWKDQKLELSKETLAEIEPKGKESFKKFMYRLPKDKLAVTIKRAIPSISDKALIEQIEYVQRMRHNDRMLLDQEVPEGGELQIMRYGANLELGLYIGQATGSYLYTNNNQQWSEILSTANNDSGPEVWSPLTKSFQGLEFNFLNNIDPVFINRLKEEGRLESFRNFLRKLWVEIGDSKSIKDINDLARTFDDELQEEYGKAKEEWSKIDKDLVKWITGSGGLSAIISGGMNWQIPALGFCIGGVGKLLEARIDRKNYKNNVPMAVFLDLEKKNKIFK
jgi:hypothetical protein